MKSALLFSTLHRFGCGKAVEKPAQPVSTAIFAPQRIKTAPSGCTSPSTYADHCSSTSSISSS